MDESNTEVISGLAICRGCTTAEFLPSRLKDRGFHLGYAYRTKDGMVEPENNVDFDHTEHKLTALGESPHESPLQAVLVHEGFKAKVTKLFKKELQVGDTLFDPKVWIRTDTEAETGAFLRLSGVQSAVLELIDMQSEINIHGSKIYVMTHGKQPVDVKQFVLSTAVLLHYLAEFSAP